MSVRDYVGGHLTTFLYAMPLLKRTPASVCLSKCLRNPPLWNKFEDYLAHYQLITTDDMLRKLTGVQGPTLCRLPDYTFYSWHGKLLKLPGFDSLLQRNAFKAWFYALFFQVALPFNCDIQDDQLIVYAPLNLTILFPLMEQLRLLGYSSHWMSECLENIIGNKVITTSRPPRVMPTRVKEAEKTYLNKKLTTTPFSAEMATLARIFQPLLPFSVPKNVLSLEPIYGYNFYLQSYVPMAGQINCLVLVLWNDDCLNSVGDELLGGVSSMHRDLWPVMDPSWGDEVDKIFKGSACEKFRETEAVFWSTFKCDLKTKIATAWMPESMVQEAKNKGWACGLWRTDIWRQMFFEPDYVKVAASRGTKWVEDALLEDIIDGIESVSVD
ncbi:hypothetical protein LSUE1_G006743 [Lachnellula suecica]|uniref:Uncharacterized protein n=1 Tax=Lachnellula suecica TaxID=602035 RepID=A0A8T9C170_9HELO|nr:hypothetical protein LSUE1_G006743 [Lachnellula suecica]